MRKTKLEKGQGKAQRKIATETNEWSQRGQRERNRQTGRQAEETDRQTGCRAKMDRQHNCLNNNNNIAISEGKASEIIRKTSEMSKNNLVVSAGQEVY